MEDGATRADQIAHARSAATAAIVDSRPDKKLVVAGPGTGKTYTLKPDAPERSGEGPHPHLHPQLGREAVAAGYRQRPIPTVDDRRMHRSV